jgi:hypothetical protein
MSDCRHWTPQETEFLRIHFGSLTLAEIGEVLDRSETAVKHKAYAIERPARLDRIKSYAPWKRPTALEWAQGRSEAVRLGVFKRLGANAPDHVLRELWLALFPFTTPTFDNATTDSETLAVLRRAYGTN